MLNNMKLPVKPKKPSKRDPAPSKTVVQIFTLGIDVTNEEAVLISDDKLDTISANKNLNVDFEDGVPFTLLEKASKLVGTNFIVRDAVNYDGYYTGTLIEQTIPNANYDLELAAYNNRYVKYKEDLAQYEKDLKVYEAYQHEQKIAKQKKRIQKLEEELQKLKS